MVPYFLFVTVPTIVTWLMIVHTVLWAGTITQEEVTLGTSTKVYQYPQSLPKCAEVYQYPPSLPKCTKVYQYPPISTKVYQSAPKSTKVYQNPPKSIIPKSTKIHVSLPKSTKAHTQWTMNITTVGLKALLLLTFYLSLHFAVRQYHCRYRCRFAH